ncbi:MAG: 2-oxo acid dehydrogenase subunit E2, partial [Ktedonobacteraceae bacterium]
MMATDVILPALGMSQETGKIVRWLKAEGDSVARGEPLVEIETDKATVEIEAPAPGILARVVAATGAEVPVGQVIATILASGETALADTAERVDQPQHISQESVGLQGMSRDGGTLSPASLRTPAISASQLAARIAAEHHVDLSQVKAVGQRIQKADVLMYLQNQASSAPVPARLVMASPKARRLAREQGKDVAILRGSGPGEAVLAADVLAASRAAPLGVEEGASLDDRANNLAVSTIWRIMAERTTQSWTSVPHFSLVREANASRLVAWLDHIHKQEARNVTYTDLLVKIVATALHMHVRINVSWDNGKIDTKREIHVGIAVAIEEGLVVPVIHQADTLGLRAIARQREALVARARGGKLHPQDISNGTFTISNLGMYGIDAFNAIINQPQAAILAVGRIAERVVPVSGHPAVQPTMMLTLSCDHRAVDGARAAQF